MRRGEFWWRVAVWVLILIAGAVVAITPMVYMVSTALKPAAYVPEFPPQFIPDNPTLENFRTAFTSRNFDTAFFNSAKVAIATAAVVTTCASMMAYAFARFEFVGKSLLFYSVLAMMMVPGMMLIIPQFIMVRSFGLLNSHTGLVMVYAAGGMAFNMFLLRGFFESLPRELEESALIDGANQFTIFTRIMLPLAKPALAAVAIFTFLNGWNDFIGPLLYLNSPEKFTVAIGLATFRSVMRTRYDLLMAASAAMILPIVVLFFFAQRYFIQGVVLSGLKG